MLGDKIMWRILMILFAIVSSAMATDLKIDDIDLAMLRKGLPEKWYVSEVRTISAPDGWIRTEGGLGIRIDVSREPYSSELKKTKGGGLEVQRPEYVICIMPRDFGGESMDFTSFKNGKIVLPKQAPSIGSFVIGYTCIVEGGYVFSATLGSFKDWKNPEELFKQLRLRKVKP